MSLNVKLLLNVFYLIEFFLVVQQFYEARVIDEFLIRGNTAILKCLVPSFVADFVDVIEWRADDGTSYLASDHDEKGRRACQ